MIGTKFIHGLRVLATGVDFLVMGSKSSNKCTSLIIA